MVDKEIQCDISSELTDEEKKKIVEEAKREVAKQLKESKKKAFKDQAMAQAKATALFSAATDETGQDIIEVDLFLASYPKYVMLDGKVYHSDRKYKVRRGVAAVLLEQMHRGWEQEEAVHPSESGEIKKHTREFRMNRHGQLKQVA